MIGWKASMLSFFLPSFQKWGEEREKVDRMACLFSTSVQREHAWEQVIVNQLLQ